MNRSLIPLLLLALPLLAPAAAQTGDAPSRGGYMVGGANGWAAGAAGPSGFAAAHQTSRSQGYAAFDGTTFQREVYRVDGTGRIIRAEPGDVYHGSVNRRGGASECHLTPEEGGCARGTAAGGMYSWGYAEAGAMGQGVTRNGTEFVIVRDAATGKVTRKVVR